MARGEGEMAGAGQRSHGRDSPDIGDASVSGGETQCGLQSEQPGQYSGEPVKRAWAKAFLGADCWNCAAWLYLVLRRDQAGGLGQGDWFVYAALQLAAAVAAMLPWGNLIRKKRELLTADEQPVEVDDDVYWKNGWYENPGDPHLLVPNRLCDTNYTFNMARPAARWINLGVTLVLVGSLGWAAWMMIERL